MKIQEILAKIAKGEALTDDEKKFLAEYKEPEGGEGRIPKERLDQEIAKRKEAEAAKAELDKKIAELTEQVEQMKTSGMSEAEKAKAEAEKQLKTLHDQVAKLTKERDDAAAKAADMEFGAGVRALADKHKFVDPDYLGYKIKAAGVKLDDADGVSGLIKALEKDSPNMFRSDAKPGSGTQGAGAGGAGGGGDAKARLDELNKKLELSSREVAEVIALQAQVKAGGNAGGGTDGATGAAGGAN
jgi:vacuolar-type H+-ATPase subunit I/STV1